MHGPDQTDIQALAALLQGGQFDQAAITAQRLVARFPGVPILHLLLGSAWANQNKLDEAVQSYGAALALKPDFFDAANNLGVVLEKQGRHAEAAESFRAALRIQPADAVVLGKLRAALGDCAIAHARDGRRDQAGDILGTLLDLEPADPEILADLCGRLVARQQYEDAAYFSAHALERMPGTIRCMAYGAVAARALKQPYEHLLNRILEVPARHRVEALVQVWAALTLDLAERAFAIPSAHSNILGYAMLGQLYRQPTLPARLGALPPLAGTPPAASPRPLIYAGADGVYAGRFAHDLIASALQNSPSCDVHLHVMNPGSYEPAQALAVFPADQVSWSSEELGPGNKTLYATRRFVRLAQFLRPIERVAVAVDIDGVITGDIAQALPGDFDVMIYERPDEVIVTQMVAAGFLAIGPGGRDFTDFLAAYILHFEERGMAKWFIDQLAIISARAWFTRNVNEMALVSAPANMMDCSTEPTPGCLTWQYKGKMKPS